MLESHEMSSSSDDKQPGIKAPKVSTGKARKKRAKKVRSKDIIIAKRSHWNFFLPDFKKNYPTPLTTGEASKLGAVEWKRMTAEQQEPFKEMARQDAKRFEAEMRALTPEQKTQLETVKAEQKARRTRKRDGIEEPKKKKRKGKGRTSGYMVFCSEVRPTLPSDMPFKDRGRQMGKLWRELTDDQKASYGQRAKSINETRAADNKEE